MIMERNPQKFGKALVEVLEKKERSDGLDFIKELDFNNLRERITPIYLKAMTHRKITL